MMTMVMVMMVEMVVMVGEGEEGLLVPPGKEGEMVLAARLVPLRPPSSWQERRYWPG